VLSLIDLVNVYENLTCSISTRLNSPGKDMEQGEHLSGKPGNVREFGTCQGNVRDVVNSQGKNLVM